ncbi:MAG TPA: Asp-tRNA(Asn)/Glu-tRNA(Gln) amidotransferase subunit GatB [Actinomycetota bacterium]|jgi:aspartyl-tRNA(Asn)/glutamyl-tRNA(Gln) amidotransferase subunit B|nr:Asp-tRNA(Asn)/Glu-tRNA(Gln) amidotransferase subunit GatB [Actinomycetota bacterium]
MAYEAVIGLECHVELSTATKMFCACANVFGAPPNTQTCPVCLGHPGTLPVPNREAIARIIKIGLALNSEIAPHSLFHRKNYFYPDMPKNYQISQYDLPICIGGHLDIEFGDGSTARVGITRVHMEEDTGKSTHGGGSGRIHDATYATLDFNRAGVPLVECVSEPDMRSPEEAAAYLRELRATLESLDVSDVKMEEGSLRCDANISLRATGAEAFGTKVEIKNMNSVRSLERALVYEIERQTKALDAGATIVQETRHWDEDAGSTASMRSKEEAFDYRYFPEPDIPAMEPDAAWIDDIRASLPELPRARRDRYVETLGLKPDVARVLVGDRGSSALFDAAVSLGADAGPAANWITQDVAALRNAGGSEGELTAQHVADVVMLIASGTVSNAGAKQALEASFASGEPVEAAVDRLGLRQVSDTGALGALADEVLAENPDVVQKFRDGKEGVIGFLVGQLMQKAAGAANPKVAQELLRERLQG